LVPDAPRKQKCSGASARSKSDFSLILHTPARVDT